MSKRAPITYDPGWITQGKTALQGKPIGDIRSHLRGVGVVQPPLRYPNQKPRETYSNAVKCEGTSEGILITRIAGVVWGYAYSTQTIKHKSEFRKTRTRSKRTRIIELSAKTQDALAKRESRQTQITRLSAIGNVE